MTNDANRLKVGFCEVCREIDEVKTVFFPDTNKEKDVCLTCGNKLKIEKPIKHGHLEVED